MNQKMVRVCLGRACNAYACNDGHFRDEDWEDDGLRPAQAKNLWKPPPTDGWAQ
jgi:hypothetical protein